MNKLTWNINQKTVKVYEKRLKTIKNQKKSQ